MADGNVYDVGDLPTLSAEFKAAGLLEDPTTVTFKVRDPQGVETSYTVTPGQIVRDSQGKYHLDHPIPNAATSHGRWYYRMIGEGSVIAAGEKSFRVRKSAFTSP